VRHEYIMNAETGVPNGITLTLSRGKQIKLRGAPLATRGRGELCVSGVELPR